VFLPLTIFFISGSDPQLGTDEQKSNQVVTDAVAHADDLDLPGKESCSFKKKNLYNAKTTIGQTDLHVIFK